MTPNVGTVGGRCRPRARLGGLQLLRPRTREGCAAVGGPTAACVSSAHPAWTRLSGWSSRRPASGALLHGASLLQPGRSRAGVPLGTRGTFSARHRWVLAQVRDAITWAEGPAGGWTPSVPLSFFCACVGGVQPLLSPSPLRSQPEGGWLGARVYPAAARSRTQPHAECNSLLLARRSATT